MSAAGHVNADPYDDVIVGARSASPSGERVGTGVSYVVFGQPEPVQVNLDEIDALGLGFKILGAAAFDQSGYSVAAAGNVNNDDATT